MHKIIDIFSGAGGLSLGAARAGFHLVGAIEKDPLALSTHIKNFPFSTHIQEDVTNLNLRRLKQYAIDIKNVTGVIGGPPCQGFSNIGHQRLDDERNTLFAHFFRLVNEISPAFFLAENVPGILGEKYNKLREQAFALVKKRYILLPPITVKASEYGAPTTRTRIFFIGYDPKRIKKDLLIEDFLPDSNIKPVFVREALARLPKSISPEWLKEENGWRKLRKSLPETLFHRYVSGNVPKGVGHHESLIRYFERNEVSGCLGTLHSPDIIDRYASLAPGEQDKISKSVRLKANGFCPTLRAGTGSDKGSYQAVRPIHPDQPRVITPREAARLQGFPDWFVFHSTKWHSFRQIGNSVSPIVAEKILSTIYKSI